tara:strand:- start:1176 stop:1298 length:123 start_codon:yes stop_codon:yes gene_type:complete
VNANNGSAIKNSPIIGRPDWEKVESYIKGEIGIDEIGCKN